jgi:hypothetical protein
MVEHLPPGGAMYRAALGHGWTDIEHLLAQVIDDVRRIPVAVFRAAGGRAKEPKPIKRPGQKDAGRIGYRGEHSTEDVVVYLDSLSATKGRKGA